MNDKIKFILNKIAQENSQHELHELIENSMFKFSKHWNHEHFPNFYNLKIFVNPEVFIRQNLLIDNSKIQLRELLKNSTPVVVDRLEIVPNYDQLTMLNTEVTIIKTKWEEINELQQKLISLVGASIDAIDYQNIGNCSRTIMNKLAQYVFNKEVHKPESSIVNVENGKYKNQFHTYINHVLVGKENNELKYFSNSAIDFVENAIDLMNQTTHKFNAMKHYAEICVISTISVIGIINVIYNIELKIE